MVTTRQKSKNEALKKCEQEVPRGGRGGSHAVSSEAATDLSNRFKNGRFKGNRRDSMVLVKAKKSSVKSCPCESRLSSDTSSSSMPLRKINVFAGMNEKLKRKL